MTPTSSLPLNQPLAEPASSNWREVVALAGVVTSVCGFAAAFFSGLVWAYSTAFAVLVLTSLVHWRSARAHAQWDRFATAVQQLDLSHRELQRSEQNLNRALIEMRTDQGRLIHNIELLRQENERLNEANTRMRELNQNLRSHNQQLHSSEQTLQRQKEELAQQIERFNENNRLLKEQIEQLERREIDLARATGAANAAAVNINRLGTQLREETSSIRHGLSVIVATNSSNISPPRVVSIASPLNRLSDTLTRVEAAFTASDPNAAGNSDLTASTLLADTESLIQEQEELLKNQQETEKKS